MKKILVIEDDTNIRESICELLELKEYDVSSASNGKEGVDVAKKMNPDMIICDIMMPGLTGHEVLEQLRKDNSFSNVPFIFLSALSTKDDVRQGMNLGADDYLTKPFRSQELYEAIEARFKKKEMEEAQQGKSIEPLRSSNVRKGLIEPIQALMGSNRLFQTYFSDYTEEEMKAYLDRSFNILNKVERSSKNIILFQSIELAKYDEEMKKSLGDGITKISTEYIRDLVGNTAVLLGRSADVFVKDFNKVKISVPEENFKVILNEIIINAYQYSKPGKLVTVETQVSDKICINVIDNGGGIRQKILDQVGKSPWLNSRGMGMGLYLSNSLVGFAGGKLSIETSDSGTKITMEFNKV